MCTLRIRIAIFFSIFLLVFIFFNGCGAIDTILSFPGTYNVNARVNGLNLDEFSFITAEDKIKPFFETSVSEDPDITALMVYLKNQNGNITGWKVSYVLDTGIADDSDKDKTPPANTTKEDETENHDAGLNSTDPQDDENVNNSENQTSAEDETKDNVSGTGNTQDTTVPASYNNGDELKITVKNFNGELPVFPVPENLPMGRYTIVYQVMSGNEILSKTEKAFFYMADTGFSFENIFAHLPGIAPTSQLIPKGAVIMLEADLKYDSGLSPYIIWYSGKKIIGEGDISEGAGNLIWKAPEQSGFFSLRAEVFPVSDRHDLAGFQKGISLLVSSKKIDINLPLEETPDILHRYLFEGDLADSLERSSVEREIKPEGSAAPVWKHANGTYGLAGGSDNIYTLPPAAFSGDREESWKIICRFKPLNDGGILSVQFGVSFDVKMNLVKENDSLILSLISPMETVSQTAVLPESDGFVSAEIDFSAFSGRLSAMLELNPVHDQIHSAPVSIDAEIDGQLKITLGIKNGNPSAPQNGTAAKFTALWDELAFFSVSPAAAVNEDEPDEHSDEQDSEEVNVMDENTQNNESADENKKSQDNDEIHETDDVSET